MRPMQRADSCWLHQPCSARDAGPAAMHADSRARGASGRDQRSSRPWTPRSALLADHELATSTLAVRIAASARTTPYAAFATGLGSIEGELHGSASAAAHKFLDRCSDESPASVIRSLRSQRLLIPGFGHKVYRGIDPRYTPLMDAIRALDPDGSRFDVIDDVVEEVGRTLPHLPNVDLALGALDMDRRVRPGDTDLRGGPDCGVGCPLHRRTR